MVVAVMGSAQRHRELVAHLSSHRAKLSEPQVVGVSGASPTDQTRLRCHEFEMSFVAMPTRLADR
jgi:glycerol dehydrogenase-like iron-containing ADH family enzyme